MDDVEVWVPDEPQFVVDAVEVEVCEPDEPELFDEEVCVDVDPELPCVESFAHVDVLEDVGVVLEAVCVDVELEDCVFDELGALPVEDEVVQGVEDDELAAGCVVVALDDGWHEAVEPAVVVDGFVAAAVAVEQFWLDDAVPLPAFFGVVLAGVEVEVVAHAPADLLTKVPPG